MYTWGDGVQYQLGRKILSRRITSGLRPEPLHLRDIVLVSAGSHHSFAVNSGGIVYAWGLNQMHQTGISDDVGGAQSHVHTPTPVRALHPDLHLGAHVIQIAAGEHHSLFLLSNGEVWGCGRADHGRLGLTDDHPVMLAIAAQYQHDLYSLRAANARESGLNIMDEPLPQLVPDSIVREPTRVYFPPPPTVDCPTPLVPSHGSPVSSTRILGLRSAERYNLAWDDQGFLYSWGEGTTNQLGMGDDVDEASTPTRVCCKALRDYAVIGASAGGQHVLLV